MSLLVTSLLALLAAPAAKPDLEAARAAIRAADIAMSDATVARSVQGFLSHLSEDVSFLPENAPTATGKAAVRELWADLFGPSGPTLSWSPAKVEVSASGELGFSTGTYEVKARDGEGRPVTRTGRYFTVWRKQKDGSWKVVFDSGCSSPPAAP